MRARTMNEYREMAKGYRSDQCTRTITRRVSKSNMRAANMHTHVNAQTTTREQPCRPSTNSIESSLQNRRLIQQQNTENLGGVVQQMRRLLLLERRRRRVRSSVAPICSLLLLLLLRYSICLSCSRQGQSATCVVTLKRVGGKFSSHA